MNSVLRYLESGGMVVLWRQYQTIYFTSIGKKRAEQTRQEIPIFGGEEGNPENSAILMVQLVVAGWSLASIVLVCEIAIRLIGRFYFRHRFGRAVAWLLW